MPLSDFSCSSVVLFHFICSSLPSFSVLSVAHLRMGCLSLLSLLAASAPLLINDEILMFVSFVSSIGQVPPCDARDIDPGILMCMLLVQLLAPSSSAARMSWL